MNVNDSWDLVATGNGDSVDLLERIRIPGGWLYRSTQNIVGRPTETMVFVPFSEEQSSEQQQRKAGA